MIMNDSVQRGAIYVRDLNIASSEYQPMTLTLGGLTSLMHEQLLFLNFFALRGSLARRVFAWYVAGRVFDPHVRQTFFGGDWS